MNYVLMEQYVVCVDRAIRHMCGDKPWSYVLSLSQGWIDKGVGLPPSGSAGDSSPASRGHGGKCSSTDAP